MFGIVLILIVGLFFGFLRVAEVATKKALEARTSKLTSKGLIVRKRDDLAHGLKIQIYEIGSKNMTYLIVPTESNRFKFEVKCKIGERIENTLGITYGIMNAFDIVERHYDDHPAFH